MSHYIPHGNLRVNETLHAFIEKQVLPGTHIESGTFWSGFDALLEKLIPENQRLLEQRDALQAKLDEYHQTHQPFNFSDYKQFLLDIDYLKPQPSPFTISTANVDKEIASIAGPQLVVPINNARYAINAANARWGSLYDAAYGTDVISDENGAEKTGTYNPVRGQKVVAFAKTWLDTIAPLKQGSHNDVIEYRLEDESLVILLASGASTTLQDSQQFVGYQGDLTNPSAILLRHHGLHAEIQLDKTHPIGNADAAGVKDVLLESAITTIMDCEDSVAAVDAEDKTLVYQNWLGLMKGTLSTEVKKGDKTFRRTLNPDRDYISPSKQTFSLSGRSLMFVRNVGHLMTSDAILFDNKPIPEGIMDGVITSLIALHDLKGNSQYNNSRTGSIYIVKPKMHGPEEVAFSNRLFTDIEALLSLPKDTIKMGIMDEERRTSVNLAACIAEAKSRVVFINTGFLDRTGDEIHTSMYAGAFAPKAELKQMPWITAYEKANVVTGLASGLGGRAQIGKGMWPVPDNMADMMKTKIGHPQSGASTAWVPSPTAATLHALHYHDVNVASLQSSLKDTHFDGIDDILTIPLLNESTPLSKAFIEREIDNNVQGILGYVVRWVHQGIGCSKVPDINHVGLMEDRATLRISSQHLANWLMHGIITKEQVEAALHKMAALVDEQNTADSEYKPMMPNPEETTAFQAAYALIFEGHTQPNGYTEPLLHAKRREEKASN
ncbi:malate synthase G [Aestuariibacter sp. AA17]|uniref:Malate synthase G n=1 Tax=Fluctibacter corallii TaxID=2984329 RepID=A0ABT3ABM5_9ALTE|nr:malate synthase G [Aestuariibacter sp. AA17]MCV2886076.1 malate synthase G [Aestuariibacter sp. AA17]